MDCKKTCKDYFRKGAGACIGCNKNNDVIDETDEVEHAGCEELHEQVITHDCDDDNDDGDDGEELLSDDFGYPGKHIYNVPVTHTFEFKDVIEVAADSEEEAISRARSIAEDRDESYYGVSDSDSVVVDENRVEELE